MERDLEAVRIGDVGVNAASSAYPLRELPEQALRREKLFCDGKRSNYCRRETGYHFVRLEQYIFCTAITEFCSLARKVPEINPFPNTLNKDRYR
jgi:hypothetical protein